MIQYTAYLFSIIFNYSFMAGFDNCFVGCLFLVTNIELFVHFWSKTRPQKVQLFVETGLKTEGMQAAAYAACIVSLIKNLEELQVSLADVEELVKLIKNISRTIPKHLGPTTKQRPADFKSLSLDKLNKLSKKVDHETFGTLGNAFAILFVEVFEVGTLDVRDWESIETTLECIVAAKHVRDFDLMDWVQEEEARKAREAEALKQKENHQKAEQEKLKQQHMMRLQEIREVKKKEGVNE